MPDEIAKMPVLSSPLTRQTRRLAYLAAALEARIKGQEPQCVAGEPFVDPFAREETARVGVGAGTDILSGSRAALCSLEVLSGRAARRAVEAIEEELRRALNGEAT